MDTNERPYPSTQMIVSALRVLGVTGPAVAEDVLSAAGLDLPAGQLPEVLDAIAGERANQSTGSGDPGE